MSETEGLRESWERRLTRATEWRNAREYGEEGTPFSNGARKLAMQVRRELTADAVLALPQVAELRGKAAEQSETIATLRDGYREAVGVPPSEHQSRRLEQMATRIESDAVVIADIRRRAEAAEGKIERVEALRGKWAETRDGVLSPGLRNAVDDLDREWFAQTVERKGRAALASDPTTHESEEA